MRRIVVWSVVGGMVVGLTAFAARQPLLVAACRFLIVQEPAHPAEAIVVLSGSVPDRILEAVDLYQTHMAPRIILTREQPLPGLAALRARGGRVAERHEQNQSIAEQLGVPPEAITVVPHATSSTLGEIEALIAYLRAQRIRSILLVTSKVHTRRARLVVRDLAGPDLQIALRASPYDPISPEQWWRVRGFARRVIIEYAKLLYYVAIDRWRAHPSEAAAR